MQCNILSNVHISAYGNGEKEDDLRILPSWNLPEYHLPLRPDCTIDNQKSYIDIANLKHDL